jgi:hypothetical protein
VRGRLNAVRAAVQSTKVSKTDNPRSGCAALVASHADHSLLPRVSRHWGTGAVRPEPNRCNAVTSGRGHEATMPQSPLCQLPPAPDITGLTVAAVSKGVADGAPLVKCQLLAASAGAHIRSHFGIIRCTHHKAIWDYWPECELCYRIQMRYGSARSRLTRTPLINSQGAASAGRQQPSPILDAASVHVLWRHAERTLDHRKQRRLIAHRIK